MRAFGRCGIEPEARIIKGFEADARCVVTHDCVGAEEFEEGGAFEFGLTGRGDLLRERIRLFID